MEGEKSKDIKDIHLPNPSWSFFIFLGDFGSSNIGIILLVWMDTSEMWTLENSPMQGSKHVHQRFTKDSKGAFFLKIKHRWEGTIWKMIKSWYSKCLKQMFFFISHLFQSVPWIKIQPEIHFVQKVCSVVGSLHQRYAHQRQHASPSTYFVKQIERPNAIWAKQAPWPFKLCIRNHKFTNIPHRNN